MERDTLIKVFALILIAAFMLELFAMRSSVTSTPVTNNTVENQTYSLYGTGQTLATLASYKEYLYVFKAGADITTNSSLSKLRDIPGVGYVNQRVGGLILILDQGANATLIASEAKRQFSDLNITAIGQFYLPPIVEFTTSEGKKNVSMSAVIELELVPEIFPGDNVTLSLIGLVSGDTLAGAPLAKMIPTQGEALVNATVTNLTDDYSAVAMIPWGSRMVNVSMIREELSKEVDNLTVNYTPQSFVMVNSLDSREDNVIGTVENLSYVTGVNGNMVDVRLDMNDSRKLESDLRGILGDNTTVDYPSSIVEMAFHSANLSKDMLSKKIGWTPIVYRRMFIGVSGRINISGAWYDAPVNTSFEETTADSYSVGQKISVWLKTGTIGRKIVSLEFERLG